MSPRIFNLDCRQRCTVRSTLWPFCPRGKSLLSSSYPTCYKQSINTKKDTWATNPTSPMLQPTYLLLLNRASYVRAKSQVSSQQTAHDVHERLSFAALEILSVRPKCNKVRSHDNWVAFRQAQNHRKQVIASCTPCKAVIRTALITALLASPVAVWRLSSPKRVCVVSLVTRCWPVAVFLWAWCSLFWVYTSQWTQCVSLIKTSRCYML
jgi:hypothetical protein